MELIDVTARALLKIGFDGFTVNINDRRILRGMLESMGFAPDTLDSVCITFDKMDKVGPEGVRAELTEKQMPPRRGGRPGRFPGRRGCHPRGGGRPLL